MVEYRSVANVGVRQPLRRRMFEDSHGREPLELPDVVGIVQQARMRTCRGKHPILHQKFDVGDAAPILLDVELT